MEGDIDKIKAFLDDVLKKPQLFSEPPEVTESDRVESATIRLMDLPASGLEDF